MSCKITRNGVLVSIVRFSEPHEVEPGLWHGDFHVPDGALPESAMGQFNQPAVPSANRLASWIGSQVSIETEAGGRFITVSQARVVAIGDNRVEWEGREDT